MFLEQNRVKGEEIAGVTRFGQLLTKGSVEVHLGGA